MMEFSVKTSTGKEFEIQFMGSMIIGVTNVLYIEFIGYKMMDIIPIFSDQQETKYLQGYEKGTLSKEYYGYVNLIESIVIADTGNVRIALTQPMQNAIGI